MNSFFERDVVTVARELLGCSLVHRFEDGSVLAGVVVETEAYHGDDPIRIRTAGRLAATG